MKEIIINQLNETYKGILKRKENGWLRKDLINFTAGASSTLNDLIIDLHEKELITDEEEKEIEEVFLETIDTLEF